jgi:hypothetical protein
MIRSWQPNAGQNLESLARPSAEPGQAITLLSLCVPPQVPGSRMIFRCRPSQQGQIRQPRNDPQ